MTFLDSPVHTTSYGDCETVTFNWQAKTDDCHDGINEKKELSPFLCFNGTNQVSQAPITLQQTIDFVHRAIVPAMLNYTYKMIL